MARAYGIQAAEATIERSEEEVEAALDQRRLRYPQKESAAAARKQRYAPAAGEGGRDGAVRRAGMRTVARGRRTWRP